MNDENLIPFNKRTESEQRAIAKKAGQASGAARRRKADLRKAAQQILDGSFSDRNGNQLTGYEIVIKGMITNLSDPKGRNWAKAMDLLLQLSGAGISKEQLAKIKADTAYTKARTKQIQEGNGSVDIEDLRPLADLLRISGQASEETEEEPEDESNENADH